MKEIQLVGVNHGVSVRSMFGTETLHEVHPPEDLVETLELGRGTSVAVEAVPGHELVTGIPQERDDMSGDEYSQAFVVAQGQHFFGAVSRMLTAAGCNVQGIDDQNLRLNVYPKHLALIDSASVLAYMHGDMMFAPRIEHRLAFSRAFIGHMDSSIREDRMFGFLSKGNFDTAVVSQAHADTLAASPELQARLGLRVAEYLRVEPLHNGYPITDDNAPTSITSQKLPSQLYAPDPYEVAMDAHGHAITRERYRRRYNAFSIGRVLGRREMSPDYLGRFYITGPAEKSLFELHVEDRAGSEFTGTIYDILGTATAEGEITPDGLEFRKVYDKTTVLERNIVPLNYRGTINPDTGTVLGRYAGDRDKIEWGMCFVMRPYDRHAIHQLNRQAVIYDRE